MSDAEALRALFDEWGRGDFRGGVKLFAHDVRFSATSRRGRSRRRAPDGVRSFMLRFLPEWDSYTVELHELEELGGGRFIANATQHGTGKGSGVDITAPVHIAIAMRDGLITVLGFFMRSREDALAALAG